MPCLKVTVLCLPALFAHFCAPKILCNHISWGKQIKHTPSTLHDLPEMHGLTLLLQQVNGDGFCVAIWGEAELSRWFLC